MRSDSLQFPSMQVVIPEPLSLTCPLAHSNLTSEPSGKSFIRSAVLVKMMFPVARGLRQLAGGGGKTTRQHQLFVYKSVDYDPSVNLKPVNK